MGTIYQPLAEYLRALVYEECVRALQEHKLQPGTATLPATIEWGSRQDAAEIAGISLPTLHALIGQGLVEARKVGRRTLINLSDLREKLASGEISKSATPRTLFVLSELEQLRVFPLARLSAFRREYHGV